MKGSSCSCPHHKVTPLLVILFALVFLLGAFDVLSAQTVNVAWPVILGVAGLTKLGEGSCKCC